MKLEPLKIENDFGKKPLALARVTDDLGFIGVMGILGSIVATAALGAFAMPLIAVVTIWDMFYRYQNPKPKAPGFADNLAALSAALRGEMEDPVTAETSLTIDTTVKPMPDSPMSPAAAVAQSLIESAIAKPLQPFLILGAPGSGKGIFASYALTLAAKGCGAEVWVVDPKADRAEAGYWALLKRHYLKDPCLPDESFGEDILEVIRAFEKRVSDRKNGNESKDSPLILFLDEVNTIACNLTRPKANEFGAKVMSLASQARSQNAAIWIGGQCAILELLGIKGQTNRDIFSQVVCVNGSQPEKARAILANLGMDKSFLDGCKPGNRYWITQSGPITAPTLKEPPARDWGSNVIDLRPGVTPTYPDEELLAVDAPPSSCHRHSDRPSRSFKLRTPTRKVFPVVDAPLPPKVEAAIAQHSGDKKLCDSLVWIAARKSKELSLRQIVKSRWATKYKCHSKGDTSEILLACIKLDLLIEIDTDMYEITV
jgi:hypothetical protein